MRSDDLSLFLGSKQADFIDKKGVREMEITNEETRMRFSNFASLHQVRMREVFVSGSHPLLGSHVSKSYGLLFSRAQAEPSRS